MKGFTLNFGLVSSSIQVCFRSIINGSMSVARSKTLYPRIYAQMPSNEVRLNASLTSKRRVAGSEPKLILFYYVKRAYKKRLRRIQRRGSGKLLF